MPVPAEVVFAAFVALLVIGTLCGIVLLTVWAAMPAQWREGIINWVEALPKQDDSINT